MLKNLDKDGQPRGDDLDENGNKAEKEAPAPAPASGASTNINEGKKE